jgi:hypothetical protein
MSLIDYPISIPYGQIMFDGTIECEEDEVAVIIPKSVMTEKRLKYMDWVRIKAMARIDENPKKEHSQYYHRKGWTCYSTLRDIEIDRIGPVETMRAIKDAQNAMKRHYEDWDFNYDKETLIRTVKLLEEARAQLGISLNNIVNHEKEMNAPIKSVELSVD